MSHSRYSFFPGDYLRDTMHLGWLEDCAYRRLLDLYYSRGRPIRNDLTYIRRAMRANEPEQHAAIDAILQEFFVLRGDGWHNKKADEELEYMQDTTEKRRKAAIIGAEKRAMLKNNMLASAHAQQVLSTCSAPTPTPTPIKKEESLKPSCLIPADETTRKPPFSFPTEFETAWAKYPKRQGTNSKKAAFKAWSARVKEGVEPSVLSAGVIRYAAHVKDTGKSGTEFVQQAATFFGPSEHYLEKFTESAPRVDDPWLYR